MVVFFFQLCMVVSLLFAAALCYGFAFFWVIHVQPLWFKWLDFKPFNCRECTTFWMTLAATCGIVLAARDYITDTVSGTLYLWFVIATLIAFVNFFIVLYIENRSIYE